MPTLHIDDRKAIARRAHDDAAERERLFAAMRGDDREEAVHAAWALTHLPKDDNNHIARHREALTALALKTGAISKEDLPARIRGKIWKTKA